MRELDNVPHLLPAGTILYGKYEVIKVLGEGGFGITYFGYNKVLDIPVAIKEYYPKGYASRIVSQNLTVTITDNTKNAYFDKWKMKFLTEARMLAKFANLPGIVNVYDFFEQNGTAYIIMEYLDGITLKNYVEQNGPMDTGTFFKRLIPVLTSLDKIHKQGLIHRDISPDNLMLMNDGFLKLFDFGAAREYSDATQQNFSVIIKPCFAPEEQYRSKGVQGPWTDVYSICATIYFSITGIVPDDSLQRVFSDELKKPSQLGVKISPKIETVLLKGMSVRSTERFDSVMPLVSAFEEAADKKIRKERNVKQHKKTSNILSKFHKALSQEDVSSTFYPTSASRSAKTEIILNTEYEPSNEQPHNIDDNQVKSRAKSDFANNLSSPNGVESDGISGTPTASAKNSSTQVKTTLQGAENINSAMSNSTNGNELPNTKTENSSTNKQINEDNAGGIKCPKCNAIVPKFAKFCGICGQSFISFKRISNVKATTSNLNATQTGANKVSDIRYSNSQESSFEAKNTEPVLTDTIICRKCKSTLPKGAKFCGKCGTKLSE